MTVSAPDSVIFDNGAYIEFFYVNPAQQESGDGMTLVNLPKLDHIVVRAPGGTAVRTCTLSYAYPAASSSNKICFLSSVSITGEGTYSFDYNYNTSSVFPKHGTFKIDHWGYYNNSSATPSSFYTHTTQGDYLEETITTTLRDPNTTAAMMGVMTAVHYPTGGRTTFEYEGHDYSNYEGDTGYPDYAPYMYNTPSYATRTTGGVRIKAIRDYDSPTGTTPVYYRTYSYLDENGHSSGVRGPMPRYGLSYIKERIGGDHIDSYLGSYNNILPADGTHIEYARVTENLPQGRNVYSYITRLDCPDGKETWDNSNIYNLVFDTEISPSISNEDALDAIFALMSPRTSMQATRGRLLSQSTYDAQGTIKQEKTIAYESYADAYETLDKFWNYQSMYLGATRVPTVLGDIRPLSTTTVTDGVSDTETLVYDSFRNVRSRTRGGQTSKTFYLQDIDVLSSFSDFKDYTGWNAFAGGSVCSKMKELNMVNLPLQTETYGEDGILHIRRYNYGFRTSLDMSAVYLQSIQEYDEVPSSGGWHTIMTYDARDIRGRVLQASDANGIPTVYVWGYGGIYPVAEVRGATLSQVKTITGLSNIENAPLSGALSSAQVSALCALTGAEVSIREYAPLVGLTKETTPDGRSTFYTYTPAGKRYQVLDDLGRKTGAALYSIENNESISLAGNWTINRTYTNAAGTTSFEDITFYDGLGYADQIVQVGASPSGARNIVTPVKYDAMRRADAKSYLPYVSSHNFRAKESTSSVLDSLTGWYNANGWSGQGAYAFSEQEYEASPRDRVLKVRKSGSTYSSAVSGSKAVQMTYAANAANEVRKLSVNDSGALALSGGYYAAGRLYKVTTTDEDNSVSVTWTDVLGRTVMTRQTAGSSNMDTYYVYDDAGHLCWVVTPKGSAALGTSGTWTAASDSTDRYCYVYTWDGRGRQMSRKIPGKAVEYFVYDRDGHLVMSQDGLQRVSSLWVTCKYDNFGRLVRRALLTSTQGQTYFQDLFEGSNTPSTVYPSSGDVLLDQTAYGSYVNVPSSLAFSAVSGVTPTVDQSRIKGLKTWEKVAVLSGTGAPTSWIQRAYYYDQIGRLIQTVEANAMGTTSRYSSGYDFLGNVTAASEQHDNDNKTSTFTYDARGRQLTESTSVNGTSVSMAYAYDPLGRPKTTTSGSGTNAVTTTDAYNIQGWLTSRTALKGSTNVFSMSLGYYSPVQSGATARYSGDISSWSWTQGSNTAKAYGFAYDGAHRLTAGQYFNNGTSTNALSEKAIGYDLAGNITTLTRYDNAGTGTTLAYAYVGNHRSTYTYDANGNVSSDGTHSLQMAYNLINLPAQIDSGSIMKAGYTYLSDGTKARALDASGVGYDYLGSFTYAHDANNNTTLESVAFGGGRVRKNGSGYDVDYYITDHLGSVRAIVNASGTITEQNDYYPFGTRHPNGLTTLSGNRWRFSGKEEQDAAFGVPYSDFGARLYDRTAWTAIDPLAEKYYAVSPYVYCNNNPILRLDLDGLTDWKVFRQGAYSFVGGVASAIGGGLLAGASGGLSAGLSVFLISDGIVAIGTGISLMTIGLVDDPQLSEKAEMIPENIPEMGGVVYDAIIGNDDHLGKTIGSGVELAIGVGSPFVFGLKPVVPTTLGIVAPLSSFVEQIMPENEDSEMKATIIDIEEEDPILSTKNSR